MEVREYLVLKYDGTVDRFPVLDGDLMQAQIRAFLCQRPGDDLVAVTEDAYIRVRPATGGAISAEAASSSGSFTK